jgi:zinc/manganese transport system substrate-binding protein
MPAVPAPSSASPSVRPPRPPARPAARTALAAALAALATVAVSACSTTTPHSGASGSTTTIQVVAAENFWGSIAAQLGGVHAKVTSIVTNPATDPHDYEPTAADARAVAGARYVIVNGIGYDAWADKLLAADPRSDRKSLDVGDLVGIRPGGNPHRWYSPTDVHRVIERITADYEKLDPADAAYFRQRKTTFETKTLAPYTALISDIKKTYAGTPIGASESIVTPLAQGLGLKLVTPATFLNAMSEGSDPTAADKSEIDRQIKNRQIKIYVYNTQNSTPDVRAQVKEAQAAGIPVAKVTETLSPARDTFQQWQVSELSGIQQALARATGK